MDTDDGNYCITTAQYDVDLLYKAYLRMFTNMRKRVFLCFYRI